MEASDRSTHPWGAVILTMFTGSLPLMAPDRGAWLALRVIGTAIYWPAFALFAWWMISDAYRWLRSHSVRHLLERLAYYAAFLGPIAWLTTADLWLPTGVLLAVLWVNAFLGVECLIGGWRRHRTEAPS